jgi:hypothetical protein
MSIISTLHRRGTNKASEDFLKRFSDAVKGSSTTSEALVKCNLLCGDVPIIKVGNSRNVKDVDATSLLLGIQDNDNRDRQFYDVVSLNDDEITVSIERLMSIVDPNRSVYVIGRDLFIKRLRGADLISSTPLEASYYWTLACASALDGSIEFLQLPNENDTVSYMIHCKDLLPGRLFPKMNSSVYNLSLLRRDTIYYANENNNGLLSHPLTDLFFISGKDELVLVDITGGDKRTVKKKKENLSAWIDKEQVNIPQYKLRGVILAPNAKEKSEQIGALAVVCWEDALKLLGGLRQISTWLK